MTENENPEYVLGRAAEELDRLIKQAAFFGDLTEHTLKLAGLSSGMRVLDVGCGAGDVSFLAASIVGPGGSVVGVDQNPDAIGLARGRAAEARLDHVSFLSGDITQLPYSSEFDAVIGRLVLIYLGDPSAGVRACRRYLKSGGLVYFQEFCEPGAKSVPPVPLFDECVRVINETFARAKIRLYSGMHLAGIYRDAGLPPPKMLAMSRVETGDDSAGYAYLAQTIRSLLPMIEKTGVATKEQVDIETLAARLKDESVSRGAVLHMPELIAAWTRTK